MLQECASGVQRTQPLPQQTTGCSLPGGGCIAQVTCHDSRQSQPAQHSIPPPSPPESSQTDHLPGCLADSSWLDGLLIPDLLSEPFPDDFFAPDALDLHLLQPADARPSCSGSVQPSACSSHPSTPEASVQAQPLAGSPWSDASPRSLSSHSPTLSMAVSALPYPSGGDPSACAPPSGAPSLGSPGLSGHQHPLPSPTTPLAVHTLSSSSAPTPWWCPAEAVQQQIAGQGVPQPAASCRSQAAAAKPPAPQLLQQRPPPGATAHSLPSGAGTPAQHAGPPVNQLTMLAEQQQMWQQMWSATLQGYSAAGTGTERAAGRGRHVSGGCAEGEDVAVDVKGKGKKRGRPRLYGTRETPPVNAAAGSHSGGPEGTAVEKRGRGPKPKYVFRSKEEAAGARRERNRRAALDSYYKQREHVRALERERDRLLGENTSLERLLGHLQLGGRCPLHELSDAGIDAWLEGASRTPQ